MIKLFAGHGLGTNPIVAKCYLKISKSIVPKIITFEGMKFVINSEDSIYFAMYNPYKDGYLLNLLKSKIKTGEHFVDVGANIGVYSIISSNLVGDSGKVFAFEPDPVSFSNIKENIVENSLQNVQVVNKAVSDKNGKASFFNSVDHSSRAGNYILNDETSKTQVETIKLDDYFEDYLKIKLIKIDVEGLEYSVLKGMKNILAENNQIEIILEINPFCLNRSKTNVGDMVDFLIEHKFNLFHIDKIKRKLEKIDKSWILEYCANDDSKGSEDIFCQR